MKLLLRVFPVLMIFAVAQLGAQSQPTPPPAETTSAPATTADSAEAATATATAAAAAIASGEVEVPRTPEFIEHAVDAVLEQFDVDIRREGNSPTRYLVAGGIFLVAVLLGRALAKFLFVFFRRLTVRSKTNLDDKMFDALEGPLATFIVIVGAVGACKALKLSPSADRTLGYAYTMAFSFVVFWFLLRVFNTILDHLHERAREKNLGVAAFMPWIKKALLTIFFIFGVLMIAQSLGADVKAFLAGLGIGGLAVALAAQDTLANIFGSVVVAVDQPFKIGETIQIGSTIGMVEDIGLRSTKIRRVDKALVVVPNKTVAAESITNLARFTRRRVEQVLGLTYDSTADQMDELVTEIRRLIRAEEEVDPNSVICYFRDFNSSSLDIWIVFEVKDPDFHKHMALRQRLNMAFMRAVEARGLSFAFPTQTLHFEGEIARRMAERGKQENPDLPPPVSS